jgi:Holliday junction resolvase
MRAVGSKGGDPKKKVKPVDIIALRRGDDPRFIQISKRKRQITPAEVRELVRLAAQAGCTPVLIYKEESRFASVDARDQKKRIDWK